MIDKIARDLQALVIKSSMKKKVEIKSNVKTTKLMTTDTTTSLRIDNDNIRVVNNLFLLGSRNKQLRRVLQKSNW